MYKTLLFFYLTYKEYVLYTFHSLHSRIRLEESVGGVLVAISLKKIMLLTLIFIA